MSELSSRQLLRLYQDGDEDASRRIFDRYLQRLLQLARKNLSPTLARRIDPEDVVQSAYRSFFVHAREGDYALRRAGDLWRLLAAITINKLHRQAERHTALKRDIRRELSAATAETPVIADVAPTPEEAAALTDELKLVMSSLNAAERTVLQMRLAGESIDEIAAELQRSERTVRRLLQDIRRNIELRL